VIALLDELIERQRSVHIEEELSREVQCYSPAEAAELLGVSERSVRREIEDGNLMAVKVRSTVKIAHTQLVRYLRSCEMV
jgi:excisionase family DNA binding protein